MENPTTVADLAVGDRVLDMETGDRGEILEINREDDLGIVIYFLRLDDGAEGCYADAILRKENRETSR